LIINGTAGAAPESGMQPERGVPGSLLSQVNIGIHVAGST